jgi:hypothetical protein
VQAGAELRIDVPIPSAPLHTLNSPQMTRPKRSASPDRLSHTDVPHPRFSGAREGRRNRALRLKVMYGVRRWASGWVSSQARA